MYAYVSGTEEGILPLNGHRRRRD